MRRRAALFLALLIAGCSAERLGPAQAGIAAVGPDARAELIMAWTTLAPNLTPRRFLPGVATGPDGRVYAFGGQVQSVPGGFTASAEVYDATTDTWSNIAPMPLARSNQATALGNDGRIYHVAGLSRLSAVSPIVTLASMDIYDPATDTYSSGPPLPTGAAQNLTGTAGLDGRIYAAGGNSQFGVRLATAAVYNPATSTWTTLPPMPIVRSSFAMATGPSGRIYAIGGNTIVASVSVATANVDAYDPATNTWSAVASLPGTRGLHSASRGADGRIYVFGGTFNAAQGPTGLTDAFAYDESTNTWSPVAAPNFPRWAGRGTLGGDGRIYFVGGSAGALATPPTEAFGPVCNQSPVVSMTVSPTELWPPNHKMITVARGISATDDCGAPTLVVTVSSNESVNGNGDGNTSSDWTVTDNGDGTFDVAVRSERSGNAAGRIYTITATATDGSSNVTVATGTVTVAKHK